MKISIISLGCSKNLVDSELMMSLLSENGFSLIDRAEEADIIIVNTCGFIDSAKEESINTIIELGEYKEIGKCNLLIVCGCLSERYKKELMDEMPEIDAVVGTGNINEIVEIIKELQEGKKILKVDSIDNEYLENVPRITSTPSYTAYIKISEGCDNFCTYCIIPRLRGKYRSRRKESIIKEAKALVDNGTKEIILIAQDTTKYGIDIYGDYKLPELLDELNKIKELEWIRILYLYPETFTDELIDSFKRNNKVIKYVDIPIQHINNNILKRMNRSTTKESIIKLIEKLRSKIKEITIRTTLIIGFPGETEEEFEELYEFVRITEFDRLGVFTYSKEEGTAAAKFEEQIDEKTKKERQEKIMELQMDISHKKNSEKIGRVYKVIIEDSFDDEELYVGRTYMDSPEIDGLVYIETKLELDIGSFVDVKITDFLEYDLKGVIVNEFS